MHNRTCVVWSGVRDVIFLGIMVFEIVLIVITIFIIVRTAFFNTIF